MLRVPFRGFRAHDGARFNRAARRKPRTRGSRSHGCPCDGARRGSGDDSTTPARCKLKSPPITESPAASPAADARPDRPGRRVRPAHVLGGALALTAAILALGAPAPWPQSHAAPATVGVGAGGPVFGPAAVTVAQGDTVTWQWQGGQHSVTSTSGAEPFDSGSQTAGPFQHTFATPGTFTYVCIWHAGMQGTVTVTPAPAAPAAGTSAPTAAATPGTATSATTPAGAARAAAAGAGPPAARGRPNARPRPPPRAGRGGRRGAGAPRPPAASRSSPASA